MGGGEWRFGRLQSRYCRSIAESDRNWFRHTDVRDGSISNSSSRGQHQQGAAAAAAAACSSMGSRGRGSRGSSRGSISRGRGMGSNSSGSSSRFGSGRHPMHCNWNVSIKMIAFKNSVRCQNLDFLRIGRAILNGTRLTLVILQFLCRHCCSGSRRRPESRGPRTRRDFAAHAPELLQRIRMREVPGSPETTAPLIWHRVYGRCDWNTYIRTSLYKLLY